MHISESEPHLHGLLAPLSLGTNESTSNSITASIEKVNSE